MILLKKYLKKEGLLADFNHELINEESIEYSEFIWSIHNDEYGIDKPSNFLGSFNIFGDTLKPSIFWVDEFNKWCEYLQLHSVLTELNISI